MNVDRQKLKLAMARACMSTEDLVKATGMPRPTVCNVIQGRSVRTDTLGRIAKALGVDPTEIMKEY